MATTTMTHSFLGPTATGGRSFEAIRDFFTIAGAAMRCASAVESGHSPKAGDLKALGISQPLVRGHLLGR